MSQIGPIKFNENARDHIDLTKGAELRKHLQELYDILRSLNIDGIGHNGATPTEGNILVGDGDSWESVPVSGDVTLTSDGNMDVISYRRHFMLNGGL
jgi:hypothetical protein